MLGAMSALRVLVTALGATAAQNVVRALRHDPRGRWHVIGVDARSLHGGVGLADELHVVPPGDDPGYADALEALCEARGADVLVPVMGPEVLAVARAQRERAGRLPVAVPPDWAVGVCLSKRRLAALMDELAIPHPRVLPPARVRDALPVFVRPDCGTGSRRARRVDDAAGLSSIGQAEVVTEYVEGPEFSVDALAWPSGELAQWVCRRREEVKGGLAVRSTVTEAPARVVECVRRLCARLQLVGPFNVQYRVAPDGGPRFFDLNPRPGGAMALSFAAGLDIAGFLRVVAGAAADLSYRGGLQPPLRLVRRWENVIVDADGGVRTW